MAATCHIIILVFGWKEGRIWTIALRGLVFKKFTIEFTGSDSPNENEKVECDNVTFWYMFSLVKM